MGAIRYIEHTADAGVEITADSREELFVLAARALYQLVMDYDAVRAAEERKVTFTAADVGELLHEWLAELLYILDADGWVAKQFAFKFADDNTRSEATLRGEPLDTERHRTHGEVKNVTYEDYIVERRDDGTWRARVIFDL